MNKNIDFRKLKEFFYWLRTDYGIDAYTEIILMNIQDVRLYNHVKYFQSLHPKIIIRKNCQFFITRFDELEAILNYKDGIFIKYSKICYSISPRFVKDGELAGGYKCMDYIDFLFLDIEKKDHSELQENDEPYLTILVNMIERYLIQYRLKNFVKIHSGNGMHLLYKITRKAFDDKRKEGYKQFIVKLEEILDSQIYKIDHCINASRCIALPFTWNHKANKQVKLISDIPKNPVNDFYIKIGKKRKRVSKQMNHRLPPDIKNSLEWKIITHEDIPKGSIHTILLFALKLLIREMKLEQSVIDELEDELNDVRDSNHKLDIDIGLEGKSYSPGIIKNWITKNQKWFDEHIK